MGRQPLPDSEIALLPGEGIARVHLYSTDDPPLHAIVDIDDADTVRGYRWRTTVTGSGLRVAFAFNRKVRGRPGGERVVMHRLIVGAEPEEHVGHVDEDGLNNRRANLKYAPRSRYRGVPPKQADGTWTATFRKRNLGSFATEVEAARAHDQAVKRAMLNFPDE